MLKHLGGRRKQRGGGGGGGAGGKGSNKTTPIERWLRLTNQGEECKDTLQRSALSLAAMHGKSTSVYRPNHAIVALTLTDAVNQPMSQAIVMRCDCY